MSDDAAAYQQLLEFFYQCPAGLISFAEDGAIHQINPAAVRLITEACRVTDFDDVYDCFATAWPDLRLLLNAHPGFGPVIENHDLVGHGPTRLVLGCTVVRVGPDRVMLVINEATARKEAEDQRAELLASEQQARHRLETLERNATHLVAATTAEEVAAAVTSELKTALGLDLTSIRVRRGGRLQLVLGPGVSSHLADAADNLPADVNLPGLEAAVTNRTIHLETVDAVRERYPILMDDRAEFRVGSLVAMPLRAADKSAIGSLVVSAPLEHWFDNDSLSLLTGLAGQTGLALERAQLFEDVLRASEQEHEIAIRLQRALLPDRIVDAPGIGISARVRAAADLMTVGGDWYDTFAWPTGEVAVVVGDIVGHDVEAAARMGRLRAGLAALAAEVGPSPAALLDTLDRLAHGPNGTDFATAVCVVVEAPTGKLRFATAGHPPPIVLGADGETRMLDGAGSPPVGVIEHVERSESVTALEPGDRVVLYSDGLVERRGETIDVGIAALRQFLSAGNDLDTDALVDRVMEDRSGVGPTDDDVITVIVQWDGEYRAS